MRTQQHTASPHTWPMIFADLCHHPAFVEVIRYCGMVGLSHIECASEALHQICSVTCGAHVLRALCEDVGACVKLDLFSFDLHRVYWKKLCFVATAFPGESWTMSSTGAIANFIQTGLKAIPSMPPNTLFVRVAPFNLTPYEVKHLTSLIEGMTRIRHDWRPAPDAPHGEDHEFYLQVQAPFSMLGSQHVMGFVDIYITWEEGEFIVCFGVSLHEALSSVDQFCDLFEDKGAMLFPVDHGFLFAKKADSTKPPWAKAGGIRLPAFGFGYDCSGTSETTEDLDLQRNLAILRGLVSGAEQFRFLLGIQSRKWLLADLFHAAFAV